MDATMDVFRLASIAVLVGNLTAGCASHDSTPPATWSPGGSGGMGGQAGERDAGANCSPKAAVMLTVLGLGYGIQPPCPDLANCMQTHCAALTISCLGV